MDFENMESIMQFLLERRPKLDLMISQHQDRMNELYENRRKLAALAQKHGLRMDSPDADRDRGEPDH